MPCATAWGRISPHFPAVHRCPEPVRHFAAGGESDGGLQGQHEPDGLGKISLASTIGGMVINTAGVTLPHGMEHPASGLKDIVHGQGLAALTPVITEASCHGDPVRYGKIAQLLGGKTAEDCAPQLRRLLHGLELTCTLSQLGLSERDIPWMAENCMKVSAAGVANHPVVFTQAEIAALYRKAM
ncbi:MAG: iron-containing alcohol dehydrogenase [Ruminococcus sp.]